VLFDLDQLSIYLAANRHLDRHRDSALAYHSISVPSFTGSDDAVMASPACGIGPVLRLQQLIYVNAGTYLYNQKENSRTAFHRQRHSERRGAVALGNSASRSSHRDPSLEV
jgi:hypothetical protein